MLVNTQVVIVGGGPVGLGAAIALARLGIHCILIEKHETTTNHPKARGINTRTMEIFRSWGIDEAVRSHALPSEARRFIWMESLQGKELARVSSKPPKTIVSPTSPSITSQDWVEKILLEKAQDYPEITLYFKSRAVAISQTSESVQVEVEGDKQFKINADYLIAADGANSFIRSCLPISMEGEDCLGEFCNIYCEMDLTKYVGDRPSVGYMFTQKQLIGKTLISKDGLKKWLVGIRYDFDKTLSKDSFTDEFCISEIKKIIGDDSIKITIINKAFWTMAALIASNYRHGRILLAGDAAHRLPPTGGLGMNTGIQDVHNLAWKLAMVINGEAKEALLDTYFQERAPVALTNITWSKQNAARFNQIFEAVYREDLPALQAALEEQNQHLNQIGLDLGFCYEEGALIRGKEPAPAPNREDYIPSTYPGSRAPHYFLQKQDNSISTLDLFGNTFVLLCTDETHDWQEAAASISTFPLICYRIGQNADLHPSVLSVVRSIQDELGQWQQTYEINSGGAVLVRPDGHIAWRATHEVKNPKKVLAEVCRHLGFIPSSHQ